MNGILPGPLWLAIASSVNSSPVENGTLTRTSKNATVNGEMTEHQGQLTDYGRNSRVDGPGEPHSQEHERKPRGG